MKELLELAERVARTGASVLIQGETGSGKEVLAATLHHLSSRCAKPCVDINCASLPEHLVESELFGHEAGAFTGSGARKPGLFEVAHSGTLLLDEVGELDPRLQAKLLRALDTGSFYRVGGLKKVCVDVRLIAATNRDLWKAVERGEFRKDLYYRLAQFTLTVPPLRERVADILPLAELFLEGLGVSATIDPEVRWILESHDWPGNARELRNVVTEAAFASFGETILRQHLPPRLRDLPVGAGVEHPAPGAAAGRSLREWTDRERPAGLEAVQRAWILKALQEASGNREKAARVLGISSRTVRRKLRQYGEDLHHDRPTPGGESARVLRVRQAV